MRKTKTVPLGEEYGRDAGKTFVITEMSATQAEKWAIRALLALGHAGFVIPEGLESAAMAAMAVVGINSLLNVSWLEAEPLLDEMMQCVQIKPSEQAPARPPLEVDIEEVQTRVMLRKEVWELHVDFSSAAVLLTSLSAAATKSPVLSTTPTSP